MNKRGLLVCLAAPSGGGKTTVAHKILDRNDDYEFSVSCTTREKRPNEEDGVDYHFVSLEEFEEKIKNGELAEFEQVHSDYYGTLKSAVENAFDHQKVLLVDIDVKGATRLKELYQNQCLTIFLNPPNIEELKKRLINRGTETEKSFQIRMERISLEMQYGEQFDRQVVNDDLEQTVDKIERIIESERKVTVEEEINGH